MYSSDEVRKKETVCCLFLCTRLYLDEMRDMMECVVHRMVGFVLVGVIESLLGVLVRSIYRCIKEETDSTDGNAPVLFGFEKVGNLKRERSYNLGVHGSGSPECAGTLCCQLAAHTKQGLHLSLHSHLEL